MNIKKKIKKTFYDTINLAIECFIVTAGINLGLVAFIIFINIFIGG